MMTEKLNICLVAHFAYRALVGGDDGHIGGVERQTNLMAKWLVRRGHKVSVVVWDEGQEQDTEHDGIRVIKVCKRSDGIPGLRFFTPRWSSLNRALALADAEATAALLTRVGEDLPGRVTAFKEAVAASVMVAEGVLENPAVDAAFALHVNAVQEAGHIGYAAGPRYASVDDFKITVHGVQAHGASPWMGIDTVVVSAQIINALQTIVSRNLELTQQPGIVTVGSIHGGVRSNIIPEKVEMVGTIRALDSDMRTLIHRRVHEIAEGVAQSMGAKVEVEIPYSTSYPVTYNDPELTAEMQPVLEAVAGPERTEVLKPITGAEDFSFFANEVPGLYISLGGKPPGKAAEEVAAHHTPDFYIDESGFDIGVRALTAMAWQYLSSHGKD